MNSFPKKLIFLFCLSFLISGGCAGFSQRDYELQKKAYEKEKQEKDRQAKDTFQYRW